LDTFWEKKKHLLLLKVIYGIFHQLPIKHCKETSSNFNKIEESLFKILCTTLWNTALPILLDLQQVDSPAHYSGSIQQAIDTD
jgi:hypothetical protein